jgi:hypothetical protein
MLVVAPRPQLFLVLRMRLIVGGGLAFTDPFYGIWGVSAKSSPPVARQGRRGS